MPEFTFQPQSFQPGSGTHGGDFPELPTDIRDQVFKRFDETKKLFSGHLGLQLVEVRRGYSKMIVENAVHLCQPAMVMHGGASFGMADTAVAFALLGIYGFDKATLTIEMKMNYLEPIPLGPVTAEAYILRASYKTAYAEVDVWANGKLAARATTTYIIRPLAKLAPAAS